jgi:hypothetical protein
MDRATKITASDRLSGNTDWLAQQREYQIAWCESVKRNARATEEDLRIATAMLDHWRSVSNNTRKIVKNNA